jgi:hypothetical protein
MTTERKRIHVALRVSTREYAHWSRAAALEGISVVEMAREAIRGHLRHLALLRLAAAERRQRTPLTVASG